MKCDFIKILMSLVLYLMTICSKVIIQHILRVAKLRILSSLKFESIKKLCGVFQNHTWKGISIDMPLLLYSGCSYSAPKCMKSKCFNPLMLSNQAIMQTGWELWRTYLYPYNNIHEIALWGMESQWTWDGLYFREVSCKGIKHIAWILQ